ncbi:MAG: hypothetical protein ACRDA0_03355 [Cetobacterium sp.]|uniref:hypothetical protein n=1 Tax=Cetobacterium sp. TaxID=2071632 RepID=UPI003F345AAB
MENKIVIKDSKNIFNLCLLILIGVGMIIWGISNGAIYSLRLGRFDMSLMIGGLGVFITVLFYLVMKVELGGVELDIENDKISFSGGAIKFNSVGETLSNLNQGFKRYSCKISAINFIQAQDKSNVNKDGKISYSYLLNFNTLDGAVTLGFSNSAQRDQVYSIIVNLNDMGIPVQNR